MEASFEGGRFGSRTGVIRTGPLFRTLNRPLSESLNRPLNGKASFATTMRDGAAMRSVPRSGARQRDQCRGQESDSAISAEVRRAATRSGQESGAEDPGQARISIASHESSSA